MKRRLEQLSLEYGIKADFYDHTGSTNDTARDSRYIHGDVVVAGEQTAGRGQRGNKWASAPGQNLTFSVVLEPRFLPAECQFFLSEAVSLSVCDMLAEYGIAPSIKWPNDIYAGDNKMAGILIENDIRGANLARSIIGIGLNVNQIEFADWLPNPTSMRTVAGKKFDTADVLHSFYSALRSRYGSLELGFTDRLEADYHRFLYRRDCAHDYRLPDGTEFSGMIRRVMPAGQLVVEQPGGRCEEYLFKEIEFVI